MISYTKAAVKALDAWNLSVTSDQVLESEMTWFYKTVWNLALSASKLEFANEACILFAESARIGSLLPFSEDTFQKVKTR
jgi:hypothetical protein